MTVKITIPAYYEMDEQEMIDVLKARGHNQYGIDDIMQFCYDTMPRAEFMRIVEDYEDR